MTASPSKSPAEASTVHPLEPSRASLDTNAKEYSTSSDVDATDTVEEIMIDNATSIVSSSFRMTITAKQMNGPWRRLLRTSDANKDDHSNNNNDDRWLESNGDYALYPPSIDEKERPAIVRHLTDVYKKVLSISPRDVMLVFEEDLVVEEYYSFSDGGIVRKSIFHVVGEYYFMCNM